jgi:hypothetical protein
MRRHGSGKGGRHGATAGRFRLRVAAVKAPLCSSIHQQGREQSGVNSVSSRQQFRLITADSAQSIVQQDPTRRIFEHWLFMLGKSPRRCKLGPTRRAAINSMLVLYEEEQLLLAIDGCAADPWCAGDNPQRRECSDIEWILRNESSVERFSEAGERLRIRADRQAEAMAVPPREDVVAQDPTAKAAALQRLRGMAARISGRDIGDA